MKRDMDLARSILLELEKLEKGYAAVGELLTEGQEAEVVRHHLSILEDAGLVERSRREITAGFAFLSFRLTWAGHEFLDAAREPERWKKAKSAARDAGGVTFDVLKAVLNELAKMTLRNSLGLPVA